MQLFTGGDAASYTSGFPSRLTYNVFLRAGSHTRLIPEMNFACNGVITGYTAALRHRTHPGDQDPMIQVWRKNTSQLGSYYKTGIGIEISSALCVGGLTEVASGHQGVTVFHCNLNQTRASVSVQAGDVLGLYLPTENNGDIQFIRLAFARVSSGPTNYVFNFNTSESQLSMYSESYSLSRPINWFVRELPQITLEFGSGKYYSYVIESFTPGSMHACW